ncbi:MAG: TonB-dependent receptor [Bacteroidales bacterium]
MTKTSKENLSSCFYRWSRLNYAIFASLGKEVKIGVLAVTMFFALPETEAKGQEASSGNTNKTVEIDQVDIIGDAIAPMPSIMSQTTFFKRDKEAAAPLQTIESALAISPSIDVRQRGGKGVQADISIRGGSSDQTMVMLNGINFTDARTGHQTHSLPIDMDGIASIAVLDGITSTGAYAGAINIVTTPQEPNYISAAIDAGAYGYIYSNVSGAVIKKRLSLFGAASFRTSNGYKENTGFVNYNSFLRTTYYSKKAGIFDFQLGYQNRSFAANGFYSLKYTNQYEHTSTIISSARWAMEVYKNLSVNSSLSYRKNYDRFELIKGEPEKVPYNYHNTDNITAELWFSYISAAGKSSLGGNYTYNHIYSTVLGETLAKPHNGLCGNFVDYTKGKARNSADIWLRHTKILGKFRIGGSAGISLSPYGADALFSIEGTYNPIKTISLTIGANRANRLPTFNDLYYTSKGYISDPNLKPENATNYRFTATYADERFYISATPYYRHGNNTIDWVKATADADWQSMQITTLNTFGIEANAGYTSEKGILREASLAYGYITTDKEESNYISKYALDYLKHKVVARITIAPGGGFALSAIASVNKRNSNYANANGEVVPYNIYGLLDMRLSWVRKCITIHVDAENITNTQYFCYGGLQMPGVWVSGGIKYTLSKNK